MAKQIDKTSEGYNIARSVLSKGEYPAPKPVVPNQTGGKTKPGFHRISIEPADNGVTVEHMPVDPKHGGGDYGKATKKVFTDMHEAHAHLGDCLGMTGTGK